MALGKEGGLGVDLGNVFEDLLPEVFLTTGGGPDGTRCVGFTCSVEEDKVLTNPWKTPLEPVGVCEDGAVPVRVDLGEVLRAEAGALDKTALPVLDAGAAAAGALESGAEPEVTCPDLVVGVEAEGPFCCGSTDSDAPLLLLTAACRILLFSSLTILSLSSLHCLSLACLSLSYTSNNPVATRMERPGASRAKSASGRGRSSTGLTPHRAHASRERGLVST